MVMEKVSYVKSYAMTVARQMVISKPEDKKNQVKKYTSHEVSSDSDKETVQVSEHYPSKTAQVNSIH